MKVLIFQKGFNYSQDGPGNRLVYHLQGCNMHCPWCSNPEGLNPLGCIMTSGKQADSECPRNAVSNGFPDIEQCSMCSKPCLETHSENIRWSCTQHDTQELIDEAKKSSMMFFGGGGVTFTGGEATMQYDALRELLRGLKKLQIDTAIETNGTHPHLSELFPLIDHLMIDFKHFNNDQLQSVAGISADATLKNIFAAAYRGRDVIVRIPLIGEFNCSRKDAQGFANALMPVADRCLVELLRYHEYGKEKWQRCGLEYKVENAAVTNDQIAEFAAVLRDNGIRLVRT